MRWTFFPRNKKLPKDLLEVVESFEENADRISSFHHSLKSDEVLRLVCPSLKKVGFMVEHGKADSQKIKVPVMYGENGSMELSFDVDAYNKTTKTVIEVEAGRAVTNYQFLKDFFESCCMDDADYLCIAVREIYRKKQDYQKVCSFFNSLYTSNRIMVPLKGILVIGY